MGYGVRTQPHVETDTPQSGDLLIFPKESSKQGARLWRNDFLEYAQRKKSSSVQESQVRKKVASKEVIVCAYAKGIISRRGYWLVENPQYVLVQYLNEQQEARTDSQQAEPMDDEDLSFLHLLESTPAQSSKGIDYMSQAPPSYQEDDDKKYFYELSNQDQFNGYPQI